MKPLLKNFFGRINFYFRAVLYLLWIMLASVLALPLIIFRFRNPDNNRVFGLYFGPVARFILSIHQEVKGRDRLRQDSPCIYILNHQSNADMAIFTGVLASNAVMIGKKELRFVPLFGLMFEAFGNILINRKDRTGSVAGLNEALSALKEKGLSIILFPEGTRSGIEGLLPFKKGAFHMAVQAQVPLVPVVSATLLPFYNEKKRHIRSGHVELEILPPIPTVGMTTENIPELMEHTRKEMLSALARVNAASHTWRPA